MKFSRKNFENWRFWKMAIFEKRPFWIFFFKKNFFFCFILMKISPNLQSRMDGLKFWCFLWFPENSLLCVKLRYTVYLVFTLIQQSLVVIFSVLLKNTLLCNHVSLLLDEILSKPIFVSCANVKVKRNQSTIQNLESFLTN